MKELICESLNEMLYTDKGLEFIDRISIWKITDLEHCCFLKSYYNSEILMNGKIYTGNCKTVDDAILEFKNKIDFIR